MRKSKLLLMVIFMLGVSVLSYSQYYHYVGGYYGTDWGNTIPPVQAFLNNIGGPCVYVVDGPYAANVDHWDQQNNVMTGGIWGIDWYEFVYSCEHGAPWMYVVNDGYVYLANVGDQTPNDYGWGDRYTNWVVLYSCQVVCSPVERPGNWWEPWVFDDDDVFSSNDRLHIVNGFHTNAYVSPAVTVSTQYAIRLSNGGQIFAEWFNCINAYGWPGTYDLGCSVFFTNCEFDTLCSFTEPVPNAFSIRYM